MSLKRQGINQALSLLSDAVFDIPRADQREAPEGGKLCCFSLLRKVLILGLVLTCGAG
jgi:hypothetical protein